jgi:chorismate synthase
MVELINQIRDEGDTIGGIVTCKISGIIAGLGEPVFDKINADLAKAMMSINAVKAFEIGSGFSAAHMKGSEHNDPFTSQDGKIRTKTNHSGGIQGGITNGEDIHFKVAFKPVATIKKEQETVNASGSTETIAGKGRHDPCVVPRAVPVVQSMAALVITDHFLRNRTSKF